MRQRLDIADLYAKALRRTRKKQEHSGSPRALPDTRPFTIDDLVAAKISALVATLDATA